MKLNDLPLLLTPRQADGVRDARCLRIGAIAHEALLREVWLTPKPGLVDRRNCGSHRDMDLAMFERSAHAIAAYFPRFALAGYQYALLPAAETLPLIRSIGLAAERDMLEATGGVNTHKGGIFALGLLCTAAGRLLARGVTACSQRLGAEVSALCAGLVERELVQTNTARTAGERLFRQYGMTGARGEAASGFATVRQFVLPGYAALVESGIPGDLALLQALLLLMAHNADTNLVSRGGLAGLERVQNAAHSLLAAGGAISGNGLAAMAALDDELIRCNLSPGGSADLLAVTWFLACFDRAARARA
jgi:triphosphoribosyl-dephospho-CoA synthase